MKNIVGIDGEKVKDNIVITFTTKNEGIEFLKFSISNIELEYVNLYDIPKEDLLKMKKKIDDIIEREIKVREIMGKEK